MNTPVDQGHVPFGPEVSWPNGFSALEHPSGGYRYPATRAEQLPAGGQGAHPYAAFDGAGYGDDGYNDPGYQGPAAQDAGIAGTRTVRGFVESGQHQQGYPEVGYAQSGYQPSPRPYSQPGYAGSSYAAGEIEMAYPSAAEAAHGADLYKQPWDYDQPLRYDGEEDAYIQGDGYMTTGEPGGYGGQVNNDGAVRHQQPAYDPTAYNGSDYSMPGVNGSGYDLSGIIGTSDFEAVGYDEPSYGRLSYDDPRYDDGPRYQQRQQQPQQRSDQTRFDGPRFDDTRLDNLWFAGEDVRREAETAGYGNDGFGESRSRSEPPPSSSFDAFDRRGARSAETRYDMKALAEPGDSTRFDVPVFDDTRMDNLRAFTPSRGLRATGALALAPPPARPRNWAEDTSFDQFADLDLTDEPVPAAFTRTLERPDERSLDRPQQDDDTAARRAVGKRRGRSGDRRQWMALGAIAVVAAGAIGGVLMKYVFSGPSGPAHEVVAPQSVDGYNRSANLEKQLDVAAEAQKVAAASSGQASDVKYGVYQMGSLSAVTDAANTQMFMFVGGKLAGASPGASITNFEQTYPGSVVVSPGSLGGQAACTETHLNGQSASMCVWFDNDTFGAVVSPTMTTAKLASTMNTVRPSLELYTK